MVSADKMDSSFEEWNEFAPLPIDRAFLQALRRLVQETVQNLGLTSAALMLNACGQGDSRYLLLAEQKVSEGMGQTDEFIVSSLQTMAMDDERFTLPESISVPVNWQGHRLGYLVALVPAPARPTLDLSRLEVDLARLVRRYRLRQRLADVYGDQSFWIGSSRALCVLDDQLLRLADAGLPVVIHADRGCGKRLAARAIHGYAFAEFRPFIESNCADWSASSLQDLLAELWANARTGSLFLRNVDSLSSEKLDTLLAFWRSEAERSGEGESVSETRLILSMGTKGFWAEDAQASLAEWLEFNALELRLPTLQDRTRDIRALGEHFVNEYRLNRGFDFSEDAWEQLEAYPWPGNVAQLKGMVQKLAVVADTSLVTASLLARWFPSLNVPKHQVDGSKDFTPAGVNRSETAARDDEAMTLHSLFGGLRDLKWEHPGVVRALDYMLTYHRHPLTPEHVSSAVKLPVAQLSQLLKYRLGMSFEQMLGKIRVEQAKVLMKQLPNQSPVEVGKRVGFSSAEVFEQTFKRLVGQTPHAYRSQFFKPLSLVRNT